MIRLIFHITYFPQKSLLTDTQVSRIRKAFSDGSAANIKFSKPQILLGPLLKAVLPLMGKVSKPLAKMLLIPLGLTAVASATNAAIQKNIFRSGITTLIISNEELVLKIIKYPEKSVLLIKGVSETIKNETTEQKTSIF